MYIQQQSVSRTCKEEREKEKNDFDSLEWAIERKPVAKNEREAREKRGRKYTVRVYRLISVSYKIPRPKFIEVTR